MRVIDCKFFVILAAMGWPVLMCHGSVNFKTEILPVLETKCMGCHKAPHEKDGKMVKPKAGLRLDAAWAILKGGESEQAAVVPKDVAKSYAFEVVSLPKDDDMFMPPKGEALTEQEVAKLKLWIEEGADFGGWEGNLEGKPAVAAKVELKVRDHAVLFERLSQGIQPLDAKVVKALNTKVGAQVSPMGTSTPLVRVDFLTGVGACSDENVEALLEIRENITQLDLARTKVTDGALRFVGQMPRLTRLDLRHTGMTDASLEQLAGCKDLVSLNLFGTAVTDAAVPKLVQLKSLQSLYVSDTKVSPDGLAKLREALPDTEVVGALELSAEPKKGGDGDEMRKRKKQQN